VTRPGKGKRGVEGPPHSALKTVALYLRGIGIWGIAHGYTDEPLVHCDDCQRTEAILRRALKKALQPRPCQNSACLSVSFGRALRRKAKHD
jgi:hypothetical protein